MSISSNRVHLTHRLGAAVLGVVLLVVGVLQLPWPSGYAIPGLARTSAVTVSTLVAGLILICSAVWGSRIASSASTALGAVFLLGGIVQLALLHTSWNVLGFQLSTALFCIIAGLLMLLLGFYGRVSGGLPPDNPYRRDHPVRTDRPDPDEQLRAGRVDEREQRLIDAEVSVAEGTASPRQVRAVEQERARKQAEDRRRARRSDEIQ
ncbi:DUF4383 domain-containing protein [Saccharopolyspora sp. 5N102]|uniref:DUF4383 domain-containing protein n=1 Tax=Saccharopolyspora sp. 5N102 TaxID=3375155 RepID=UPI0037BC01A5